MERLKNALSGRLDILTQRLLRLKESYILRQPLNMVVQYEQMIDDLKKDMAVRIDHLVKMRAEGFNLLAGKLGALSPLAILGRGYSITMKIPGGGIMRDSMDLKAGDRVETRLGRGKFISRVEEK